jgi:hypothetical protein
VSTSTVVNPSGRPAAPRPEGRSNIVVPPIVGRRVPPERAVERTCIECGDTFLAGPKARLCPKKCRQKNLRHNSRKYDWTPERDEMIRSQYAHLGAKGLGAKFGYPAWQVQRRAAELGAGRVSKARPWTPEEVAFLEEYAGVRATESLARHLRRSLCSVAMKMADLKLSRAVREGHNSATLAACFGVSAMTVSAWVNKGLFGKVEKGPRGRFMITDAQILAFVRDNPRAFQLARVDQTWFLDLLFNREAGARRKRP